MSEERDILAVRQVILGQISDNVLREVIASRTRNIERSAPYRAPEQMPALWRDLGEALAENLGAPDTEEKKLIQQIFSGERDYREFTTPQTTSSV